MIIINEAGYLDYINPPIVPTEGNFMAKYIGRRVLVEVDLETGDYEYPSLGDDSKLKKIGALMSKDVDFSADTIESAAGDSLGGYKEGYTASRNATFDFDGELEDTTKNGALGELVSIYNEKLKSSEQPKVWLVVTTPRLTYTFRVNMTSYAESDPSDGLATYSISFASIGGGLPPKVEPTS